VLGYHLPLFNVAFKRKVAAVVYHMSAKRNINHQTDLH